MALFSLQAIRYHLLRKYKSLAGAALKRSADKIVEARWTELKGNFQRRPNALNPHQTLMINLTSFPARFATLDLTLKSLLLQNTQFDQLNLWLYHEDIKQLPESVTQLTQYGLRILPVANDMRSYKKLIPALREFSTAFHVTADDDIYYRENWLQDLTQDYSGNDTEILCCRAHRIKTDKPGGGFCLIVSGSQKLKFVGRIPCCFSPVVPECCSHPGLLPSKLLTASWRNSLRPTPMTCGGILWHVSTKAVSAASAITLSLLPGKAAKESHCGRSTSKPTAATINNSLS